MNTFKGSNNDIRELMIFAFRYALGRASMAPYSVSEVIKQNKDLLSQHDINLIIEDVKRAKESNMAGMGCDVRTWEGLVNFLEK